MMTKLLAVILAVLIACSAAAAQDEQIVWEKDFKKAQILARETGRPLLLDFTAPWCKPCKAMDERFWVLADVVKAMKPFVAVKVDFDNEKGLVGKYSVSAIPFVAFADPLGNMVTFRRGFSSKNANELNQIFSEMPKDFSSLKTSYAALETKKDDHAALVQIADAYRGWGMLSLSGDFYKKALKTDEIKADAEKSEIIRVKLALNYYALKDYRQANNYFEDYLKDYPAGKHREIVVSALTVGYAGLGKTKEAVKYLEVLKTEFPASKNLAAAENAVAEAKNKREK